jgi:hypothetical protein
MIFDKNRMAGIWKIDKTQTNGKSLNIIFLTWTHVTVVKDTDKNQRLLLKVNMSHLVDN